MYFSKFPILNYPLKDGETFRFALARNIIRRIILSEDLKSRGNAFIEYSVKDGERPEHIADKLYGDPSFHWIVLLTNDVIDAHNGWYKSSQVVEEQIQKKYSGYSLYFTTPSDGFFHSSQIAAGASLGQGANTHPIQGYSPEMCKIAVQYSGFEPGSATIRGVCGSIIPITVHRVEPSYISLHHFSVEGASGNSIGSFLDPLSQRLDNPDQLGNPVGVTSQFYDTYIGRYMGISGDKNDMYVVNNKDYEMMVNESRRTIKLLHPRFRDRAIQELETLLRV